MGLAPRLSVSALPAKIPSGSKQAAKTPSFRSDGFHTSLTMVASALFRILRETPFERSSPPDLIVFFQVHARVQTRHLLGITVEHQRLTLGEFADTPFAGLAPARVRDVRVDVGVEPVLVRSGPLPGADGLLLDEAHLD